MPDKCKLDYALDNFLPLVSSTWYELLDHRFRFYAQLLFGMASIFLWLCLLLVDACLPRRRAFAELDRGSTLH